MFKQSPSVWLHLVTKENDSASIHWRRSSSLLSSRNFNVVGGAASIANDFFLISNPILVPYVMVMYVHKSIIELTIAKMCTRNCKFEPTLYSVFLQFTYLTVALTFVCIDVSTRCIVSVLRIVSIVNVPRLYNCLISQRYNLLAGYFRWASHTLNPSVRCGYNEERFL